MPKSVAECRARISGVLRWLTSAASLIDRRDRTEALLDRYEKLDAYLEVLNQEYVTFCQLVYSTDTISLNTKEAVEADVEQAHELSDAIAEAARTLTRPPKQPNEEKTTPTPQGLLSRLPTLDLPKFDGLMENWVGYTNLFDSLVDCRKDLAPSQKMAYLMSTLKGEPLTLVQHLQLTDENYSTARELLTKRYHNVRRLADTHVSQLLSLPRVTRVTTLRVDLLNPLVVTLNALRHLNLPVDDWSFLLLHLVLSKLPQDIKVRFEQKYGGDSVTHLPPFSDMLQFLEDECRMVDNSGAARPPVVPVVPPLPRRSPEMRPPKRDAAATGVNCSYCKEPGHHVVKCSKFLSLRVRDRRGIAKQRRWCFSCLHDQHWQRDCPHSQPCGHCGGNHHPVVCANQNGEGGFEARRSPRTGGGSGRNHNDNLGRRSSTSPYHTGAALNSEKYRQGRGKFVSGAPRDTSSRDRRFSLSPIDRPRLEQRRSPSRDGKPFRDSSSQCSGGGPRRRTTRN